MTIGIKATREEPEVAKEVDSQESPTNENRSMRKTVTIDFRASAAEGLSNSVASADDKSNGAGGDEAKMHESVQTNDLFLEIGANPRGSDLKEKRSSKLLSPAVISLAHLPEEDSLGSTLENLFLGTPTLQDRPKHVGRLASVNDRP